MTLRADGRRIDGGAASPFPGMTAPAGPSARVLAPEEAAFAQAIAAGDERAFQLLIERHATPVLRICYRILGSVEEAEDAVQETFVLAFRARATFRGEGTAEAWLARIATRESWRRRARSNRRRAGSPCCARDAPPCSWSPSSCGRAPAPGTSRAPTWWRTSTASAGAA